MSGSLCFFWMKSLFFFFSILFGIAVCAIDVERLVTMCVVWDLGSMLDLLFMFSHV